MKYQRLEDLRTDRDLTIRQVADYLGCNRDVYTRYEKGVRQLPISIAIRLAELYQVSLDYLVGTQRYRLQRGDIVIIPPGISHRPLFLDLLTEPYRRMVLWISCNFAASFSRLFPIFQQK